MHGQVFAFQQKNRRVVVSCDDYDEDYREQDIPEDAGTVGDQNYVSSNDGLDYDGNDLK